MIYPDPRFRAKGKDGVVRPTWKCRLNCVLLLGQEPVCAFFNLCNEENPEPRRGSEYRRVWIMANGSAPHKRQRMTKSTFKGKHFHVQIGDTRKDVQGREHPEGAIYSTIKKFIECVGP